MANKRIKDVLKDIENDTTYDMHPGLKNDNIFTVKKGD